MGPPSCTGFPVPAVRRPRSPRREPAAQVPRLPPKFVNCVGGVLSPWLSNLVLTWIRRSSQQGCVTCDTQMTASFLGPPRNASLRPTRFRTTSSRPENLSMACLFLFPMFRRLFRSTLPLASVSATIRAERMAKITAVIACVWFALAAAWGLFGAIGAGHYAAMTSEGIIGENMWRWGIWGPVWNYTDYRPPPSEYYCHHPWGVFYLSAIAFKLFGHRDFICPLPAVLMSAATPVLFYKTAKEVWGVIPACAAACGFVLLPITLGFANFHALEVTVIFGCALFFWGFIRMQSSDKVRHLVASLVGLVFAAAGDWPAYLIVGTLLGWVLVRAYVLPRHWFPRIRSWRYAQWWALSATVSVLLLVLWVGLFHKAGKLSDWLGSGEWRSNGADLPLRAVLESRKFWIELSFTPLVIFLGKLALPIAALRLLFYRRDVEVLSLAFFVGAAIQYVVFKNGADIHIFWPHYFGAYYALAFAQLVATVLEVSRWLMTRYAPRASALAPIFALSLVVLPSGMLVPDALRTIRYARETGGRFNEKGHLIQSDLDLVEVAKWLRPQLAAHATVGVDAGTHWGWHHAWALGGLTRVSDLPSATGPQNATLPFWVARRTSLAPERLANVLGTTHARLFGDILVVDTRQSQAPLDAFSFNEREPNLFEWYFVSGVEPVVNIAPDPFATWEARTHYGQPANVPSQAPRSIEEVRIAHNAAVSSDDRARASQLRGQIEQLLDRTHATQFTQGVRLLGTRVTSGVHPKLQVWFEADGPTEGSASFAVHSKVERANRFSLIPADPTERDCAYPPLIPTKIWRPRFLYVIECSLYKRIGLERYFGTWIARDAHPAPSRLDGQPATDLAILP